ncbi:MAG: polysaccharide biosynthesis/export family protein [Dokdonella sp.]
MKRLWSRHAAMWSVILLLVACSSGPTTRQTPTAGNTLPPPDSTSATGAYKGGTDYRVGAQDLLEITVFGVPDLSRAVRVNSNGQISLPLIGGIEAGGKTIPELEKAIGTSLEKTYLQNPQVTVFVKEYTSQRVTLQGAFKKPGIYPLTGTTTLLQSVAIAGGFDDLAEASRVVVFRKVEGKKMAAVFDMEAISNGAAEDPLVYGDDIVVVSNSTGKSAFFNIIKTAPFLGLFFLL